MTDIFRKTYTPVTQANQEQIKKIKEKAEELLALFEGRYPSSDSSFPRKRATLRAITKLEEAVMWIVKDLTSLEKNQ